MTLEQLQEYDRESYPSTKRREPGEYCTVRVLKGTFPDEVFNGAKKWYHMMEGEEVFVRIDKDPNGNVRQYTPVYLQGVKMILRRGIDPQDCVII
jgi:hypothetical protein